MSAFVRMRRWIGKHLIFGLGLLVLVYMFMPIAVVVLMTFNDNSESRIGYKFHGFTWKNWCTRSSRAA